MKNKKSELTDAFFKVLFILVNMSGASVVFKFSLQDFGINTTWFGSLLLGSFFGTMMAYVRGIYDNTRPK